MEVLEDIKKRIAPEQILTYFGYEISPYNKVVCPFHADIQASMYVNSDFVYCFGCKQHWNIFTLTQSLLKKHKNFDFDFSQVLQWLMVATLPEKNAELAYNKSSYSGPVPEDFITYWQSQLTDEHRQQLCDQRLFTLETIERYGIGWRPDYEAVTIPYYRGELKKSPVDIVQFRMPPGADPKYLGLKGHSRGSLMNAFLLATPQPYVVVLFGAFDPILAYQDGVIAVGTSGACPFKAEEKERIQELFQHQSNIVVIPDNSPGEFMPAEKLAKWVGGRVKYFPSDLPNGTDYIDYRKTGHTAQDFLIDVAEVEPLYPVYEQSVKNLLSLIRVGDRLKFTDVHLAFMKGVVAADIAKALAQRVAPSPFSFKAWKEIQQRLYTVTDEITLKETIHFASEKSYECRGGW
jgi:hypothetical protein